MILCIDVLAWRKPYLSVTEGTQRPQWPTMLRLHYATTPLLAWLFHCQSVMVIEVIGPPF